MFNEINRKVEISPFRDYVLYREWIDQIMRKFMQLKAFIPTLFLYIFFFLNAFIPATVFASIVKLYDQPVPTGKMIGNIDSTNMITIFNSGAWIKVGDPKNGNVGWIKASDVTTSTPTPAMAQPSQTLNNNAAAVEKERLRQQQIIEQTLGNAFQNLINSVGNLYHQQMNNLQNQNNPPVSLPLLQPPQNNVQPAPAPASPNTNVPKTN